MTFPTSAIDDGRFHHRFFRAGSKIDGDRIINAHFIPNDKRSLFRR
jgi:hypothetical protein